MAKHKVGKHIRGLPIREVEPNKRLGYPVQTQRKTSSKGRSCKLYRRNNSAHLTVYSKDYKPNHTRISDQVYQRTVTSADQNGMLSTYSLGKCTADSEPILLLFTPL